MNSGSAFTIGLMQSFPRTRHSSRPKLPSTRIFLAATRRAGPTPSAMLLPIYTIAFAIAVRDPPRFLPSPTPIGRRPLSTPCCRAQRANSRWVSVHADQ